jgi:outer membrane protein TolC
VAPLAKRVLVSVFGVVAVTTASPARAQPAPVTLRQAVVEALAASPVLRPPDDSRALAGIREQQARARFGVKVIPAFQTGADAAGIAQRSVGLGLTKRLQTGGLLRFDANAYRYGEGGSERHDNGYTFSVSQPLLRGLWATATADLTNARRGTEVAGRAYLDARQQLVVSVAGTYFAVTRSRRLLEAAERSVDRAETLRVSSVARSKVGLATELDVLRADLLAAQSQAQLVAYQEAVETTLDALKLLLGRPADSVLLVADEALDTGVRTSAPDGSCGAAPDDSVDHRIQTALRSRFDVQEARDRVVDARRAQSVARWNLLPPVMLDVSYTRRGFGASSTPLFGELFNGWRMGMSTSYALDRSDESAAAATTSVAVRAAEQVVVDTERRGAEEVRRACRAWARTASTIDIQSKAVILAARQSRLAQVRYERGIAGNFDVIDAETNLLEAQSRLIDAQVERAMAELTLQRVTGTLDPDGLGR